MNLVIKGADFSAVSIGKVDMKMKRVAGIGNSMIQNPSGLLEYLRGPYVVNVYQLPSYAKKLNIYAKGSATRVSCSFCSGTMPTTTGGEVEDQTNETIATLNGGISVISTLKHTVNEMHLFENVDVPVGSEFVMVYSGTSSSEYSSTYAEIIL